MNYWKGQVNPPVEDWVCAICETYSGLTWGMASGRCRCNLCHTAYDIKTDYPIPAHYEEYTQVLRRGWTTYNRPIDSWTDDEWEAIGIEEAHAAHEKADGPRGVS